MYYNCALTVDCVVFLDDALVLIKRGNPPFKGNYALPGGFVDEDETVEDACRRELHEETGLKADKLELIGVYSKPGRDPRGRSVSVAFLARSVSGKPRAGDDAARVEVIKDWEQLTLAFDHREIVNDAYQKIK